MDPLKGGGSTVGYRYSFFLFFFLRNFNYYFYSFCLACLGCGCDFCGEVEIIYCIHPMFFDVWGISSFVAMVQYCTTSMYCLSCLARGCEVSIC